MNIMNTVQRTLGLLLLLLLLAVDGVALKFVPTEAGTVYTVVSTTLLAVACVVAGYFLRTFWALLIVPVVFWESAYLFGVLTLYTSPKLYFVNAILLAILTIPIVLFALLGVLLGKRSARTAAAIAAS
jgi:hypothetical protein